MAGVSFAAHRLELLASYQEVIEEESPTDWALYTYEDDSDNLKLAASGGGGLQELSSHFENQKVMYGFCSVKDPLATLPKYVLVNWVGEDVADARKCACASHVPKIAEFFQGVDVIVNASSVEDIDPGAIGQRLSNGLARIASPVLHRLRLREDENTQPVGTTYQKTDAAVEMKRINREQFWEQAKVGGLQVRELWPRMGHGQLSASPVLPSRRKQQSLEAEEAKQRLKEQSIFQQQEEEDKQQPKKSESEVEEAAAIIAQRPENPREFFKQQERVASGSLDTPAPISRTGRLHCPFIKTPDSGPPSSSSSSSSPPRTPFPYVTCHRTPNLSSFFPCSQTDTHRKASASGCSPCNSSTASTPVGEQIDRALDEVTQQGTLKDSPSPSTEEATVVAATHWTPTSKEQQEARAEEPPGVPAWQGADWTEAQEGRLGPTDDLVFLESKEEPQFPAAPLPTQPPAPPAESLLDLWQNDTAVPAPDTPVDVPLAAPEPPPSAGLADDNNLLNFDELPEPPATFCDTEQDEEPASIIAIEGPHQMTLSYQHALQEASGACQETQLLTNGETVQKEGTFRSPFQDDFNQSEEPSAKAPPPVFYNKPPEIDITCWDADPVPEDEESFGGSV
uniref:Drebrin n=1 Tax=Sphenodon punctatus TaxID=8508 RepID=A0A8D0GMF4_SPHPU